jgi:hypothetical protein
VYIKLTFAARLGFVNMLYASSASGMRVHHRVVMYG